MLLMLVGRDARDQCTRGRVRRRRHGGRGLDGRRHGCERELGRPGPGAPAKRLLKVDGGCKDRVRGAGDADGNRSSNDAVVVGERSVAQRDANVSLLRFATRAGGALGTGAGSTAGARTLTPTYAGSPPSITQAHRPKTNVSPADPAATDATPTPTRTKSPRPPISNAAHPTHAASPSQRP